MIKTIKNLIEDLLEDLTYEATMSADKGDVYDFKTFILKSDVKFRFRILAVILGQKKFNQLLGIKE